MKKAFAILLLSSFTLGLIESSEAANYKHRKDHMSEGIHQIADSDGFDMADVVLKHESKRDATDSDRINSRGDTTERDLNRFPMKVVQIPANALEAMSKSNAKGIEVIAVDWPAEAVSQPAQMTAKLPYGSPEYVPIDPNVEVVVPDSRVGSHPDLNVRMRGDFKNPPQSGIETFRDRFNATSFGSHDDSIAWSGAWQEISQTNGASWGTAREYSSYICASGKCLRLGASQDDGGFVDDKEVVPHVDLSDSSIATLSYDYRRTGGSSSSVSVRLEASNDSGLKLDNLAVFFKVVVVLM